ncbi:MAG TPA: F0F1 ATP synthase subunit A [Bacillales bacterium]|nr:F0F1 ATP synthase subunit A [Bacillales bacterium]
MDEFIPTFTIGGLVFSIPMMFMTVITALLVLLFTWMGTRKMTPGVPKGMQNLFEWIVDFIRGFADQFMGKKVGHQFVTLTLTLFLYILISNLLELFFMGMTHYVEPVKALGITEDLIQEHEGHVGVTWWKSPTATASVTFSLALVVLLYSHYLGLKRGVKKYLKRYTHPNPFLGPPLAIMEEFLIKPLTLPLRLFGNIFAGEVLILFLLNLGFVAAALPLLAWLGYSVFIAGIQAFIFTALSMVYISDHISDEH